MTTTYSTPPRDALKLARRREQRRDVALPSPLQGVATVLDVLSRPSESEL
ncbi:MAG: hypothetical protein ABSE93_14765 [Terriglobia bacterium]|jgi:hypothetical protein